MQIQASDVKKLREATGSGLMDCKKALNDANGDFSQAEKILKELGKTQIAKRSQRATNEGRIFIYKDYNKACILELSCETDFVVRNETFVELGNELAKTIVKEDIQKKDDAIIDALITEKASIIKENISLKRFLLILIKENEFIHSYLHGESASIGSLVKIKSSNLDEKLIQNFAFDLSLHVAAFNPLYLSKDNVKNEYLEEQKEIFTNQAKNLNKPEHVVEGIVKGKINKHLSEICLLDQGFVKDEKQSISQYIKNLEKETNAKIQIIDYIYYKIGE